MTDTLDITGADAFAACRALGIAVPDDFPCPTCKAKKGELCKRPSGHTAANAHLKRFELAGGPQLSDEEWTRVVKHLAK